MFLISPLLMDILAVSSVCLRQTKLQRVSQHHMSDNSHPLNLPWGRGSSADMQTRCGQKEGRARRREQEEGQGGMRVGSGSGGLWGQRPDSTKPYF